MSAENKSSLTTKLLRGFVVLAISTALSLFTTADASLTMFLKATAVTYATYNLLGFLASFPLLMIDPRPVKDPGMVFMSVLVFAGAVLSGYLFNIQGLVGLAPSLLLWGVVNIAFFWTTWTLGEKLALCPKIEALLPDRD